MLFETHLHNFPATITSILFVTTFFDSWTILHGIPSHVSTGNRPQIVCKCFTTLCILLGLKKLTTAYRLQANGEAQWYSQKLVTRLRYYILKIEWKGTLTYSCSPILSPHDCVYWRDRPTSMWYYHQNNHQQQPTFDRFSDPGSDVQREMPPQNMSHRLHQQNELMKSAVLHWQSTDHKCHKQDFNKNFCYRIKHKLPRTHNKRQKKCNHYMAPHTTERSHDANEAKRMIQPYQETTWYVS